MGTENKPDPAAMGWILDKRWLMYEGKLDQFELKLSTCEIDIV
jgi:hypothetical protein